MRSRPFEGDLLSGDPCNLLSALHRHGFRADAKRHVFSAPASVSFQVTRGGRADPKSAAVIHPMARPPLSEIVRRSTARSAATRPCQGWSRPAACPDDRLREVFTILREKELPIRRGNDPSETGLR